MKNQLIMPTAEPFLFPGGPVGCLLVHGFTGTPKEMRLLGEHLHAQGHTVLGIRLAGHATQLADMTRTRWQDWLASVEDGLHLLGQSTERIFVMGLSMGGILTLIAAARYAIAGAVAMATPFEMPKDWRLSFIGIVKYLLPEVDKGEDDWNDPRNAQEHKSYPKYPTASLQELVKVTHVLQDSLPEIRVPVLLINSINDGAVPKEHAQKIYDRLGTPDKEMRLVENSGHVITRDSERDVVFSAASDFIKCYTESI
jgi:carboxylesterase